MSLKRVTEVFVRGRKFNTRSLPSPRQSAISFPACESDMFASFCSPEPDEPELFCELSVPLDKILSVSTCRADARGLAGFRQELRSLQGNENDSDNCPHTA